MGADFQAEQLRQRQRAEAAAQQQRQAQERFLQSQRLAQQQAMERHRAESSAVQQRQQGGGGNGGDRWSYMARFPANVTPNRVKAVFSGDRIDYHYMNKGSQEKGHSVHKNGEWVYSRTIGRNVLKDK